MSTQDTPVPSATRWWTLGAVALAGALQALDTTITQVAIPQLRHALGADLAELQWVIDAYTLTLASFLIVAGSLADRFGRKRLMAVGLLVFIGASLVCSSAGGIGVLDVGRGVQGVGGSMLFAIGPALIAAEFRGRELGVALGIFGGVSGFAIALGPLVGGALLAGPGWRWIFLVNVPVAVVSLVLLLARTPESRAPGRPADWPGTVTFFVAVGSLVLALLQGGTWGWGDPRIVGAFAVAVLCVLGFLVVERRRGEDAMFELSLFRNTTFNGISALAFVANAAGFPAIFFVVSYLQNVLGFSSLDAGLRILPWTVMLLIGSVLAGSLSTRMAASRFLGLSMLLIAVGFLLALSTAADSSWLVLLPLMVVSGIGMGLWAAPRLAVAMGVVPPRKAGLATGINETFQQVGICVGIAAAGAYFQNRVAASLAGVDAGTLTGHPSGDLAREVASGNLPGGGAPAALVEAAQNAFVGALHSVMVLVAVLALIAAVIAFRFVRARDMYAAEAITVAPSVDAATAVGETR